MFGASRESIFYDGFFLTIIGQSTFISAYTMLVFISRLQRFETVQEEAALDLGATHWQSFKKILLPFLTPAIASASVLAFLASFENYNTTVFTAVKTSTLTTVLASKVRYGIDPSISALAVVIVVLTLIGAAIHEVVKRREIVRSKMAADVATGRRASVGGQKPWYIDPAFIMIFLVVVAGAGTAFMAGTMGVEECKVIVKEEKQRSTQERIKALRERNKAKREAAAAEQQKAREKRTIEKESRTGTENFNNIFSTDNLAPSEQEPESKVDTPRTGTENFNNVFSTDNLAPTEQEPESKVDTPRTGTENFNNIFETDNLAPK